jgi:alkanesulfonate monooxygenase SsuD/methylene tetrahydromethanopterin reductase-like flavin-dependent oxidoreductase (luciferase family)
MARLPLTFGAPAGGGSFDQMVETAKAAEAAGFDSLSFGDRPQAPGLDGWTVAAAIAARTDRIRLFHTTLNLPYRYPQLIAKQAATLDVISNGRLDLCLGAGGTTMSADYDAYGIPLRPVGERLTDLADAIELMRGLWSNEKFTFESKHFQVTDAVCDPKPVQGTIPIWTGASKPRGLRIVGRLADGWIKNRGWASLEEITGMIAIAEKSAVRAGRDPDSIRCVLGGTGFVASKPAEAAEFQAQNPSAAGLVGTPAEILAKIASYHNAGVDTFLVRPEGTDAAEQLARFGKEIIPEVKRLAAAAG